MYTCIGIGTIMLTKFVGGLNEGNNEEALVPIETIALMGLKYLLQILYRLFFCFIYWKGISE